MMWFVHPRNRRPYYAVSNRGISKNFISTRHNTSSVTVPCRIETDSTVGVSSGQVDRRIRQEPLGCYCSGESENASVSTRVVSCRILRYLCTDCAMYARGTCSREIRARLYGSFRFFDGAWKFDI